MRNLQKELVVRLYLQGVVLLHLHAHRVRGLGQSAVVSHRRDELHELVLHVAARIPSADDSEFALRVQIVAQYPKHLLDHLAESVLELLRVPAGRFAARLLKGLNGSSSRDAKSALSAAELVLSAVLLHAIHEVIHRLINLPVQRRCLHRLNRLADVVALPLDDGAAHVRDVFRIDAASAPDEVPLYARFAGIVVDVLEASVDHVLCAVIIVYKPRAERLAPYAPVLVQDKRIPAVRVYAVLVFRLSRAAEAQLRAVQQRVTRQLRHMHHVPTLVRVIPSIPEFQQHHAFVALCDVLQAVIGIVIVGVGTDIAACMRVMFFDPRNRRVRHLEACASVLNVFLCRIGVEVLRMPRQHVDHAVAVLKVVVPKHLCDARSRNRRVLHQRLIRPPESRLIQGIADNVAHLFRALRRFLAFRHHNRFRHVVDLVGDDVVNAAVQGAGDRGGQAPLLLLQLAHHACRTHVLVCVAQLVVEKIKQRVCPAYDRLFLRRKRLFTELFRLALSDIPRRGIPLSHASSLVQRIPRSPLRFGRDDLRRERS